MYLKIAVPQGPLLKMTWWGLVREGVTQVLPAPPSLHANPGRDYMHLARF